VYQDREPTKSAQAGCTLRSGFVALLSFATYAETFRIAPTAWIRAGGARFYKVLAVVRDKEDVPGLKVIDQRVQKRSFRRLAHAQDERHRLGREIRVRKRLHEPCPVPEPPRHLRSHREAHLDA
jgi:hypothetical protein